MVSHERGCHGSSCSQCRAKVVVTLELAVCGVCLCEIVRGGMILCRGLDHEAAVHDETVVAQILR